MHCAGILCCVHEAAAPVHMYQESLPEIIPSMSAIHLHENKRICAFTLRELMDQIECIQLNWGRIVACMREGSRELLKGAMARVGFLATHAFETPKTENGYDGFVLDDPQHICMVPPQGKLSILARKSLRQAVCILMTLGRVQAIVCGAVEVPEQESVEDVLNALKQHHIEASMDFFNGLQQMMLLAPGMRLVYRTNFSGMYNNVSQVIYFHFPNFCRQPQKGLNEVAEQAMTLLPLITELLPDVPVAYDDDSVIAGLTSEKRRGAEKVRPWTWLISCGSVFLVEEETGEIFSAASLLDLVCFYLIRDKRELGEKAVEGDDVAMQTKRRKRMHEQKNEGCMHGHMFVLGT
jgi:hypothetical protein